MLKRVVLAGLLTLVATNAKADDVTVNGWSNSSTNSLDFPAIINGTEVSSSDPIAHTTVVIYGQEVQNGKKVGYICTGSILTHDVILTASHCLLSSPSGSITVVFGTNINDQSAPKISVVAQKMPTDAFKNPNDKDEDDIGLLRLASDIPSGFKPATLVQDDSSVAKGTTVTLAGYGITVPLQPKKPTPDNSGAGVLRQVDQVILDPNYGSTEILVDIENKGSCHGDSGGPAFINVGGQLQVLGVASRMTDDDAVGRGRSQQASCSVDMVYTNVVARAAWIKSAAADLESQSVAGGGSGGSDDSSATPSRRRR